LPRLNEGDPAYSHLLNIKQSCPSPRPEEEALPAEVEGGWFLVQGEKSLEYFTICQEAGTKINIPMITYRFVQKDYE
jgi:hypothetical protein